MWRIWTLILRCKGWTWGSFRYCPLFFINCLQRWPMITLGCSISECFVFRVLFQWTKKCALLDIKLNISQIHMYLPLFFLIQNSYFTDDPPENVSVEQGKSNCVHVQWGGLSPEKFAAFDGYRVFYALFSHPTFSLNKTVNASTHWVEICNLESSMKYKFYVQRILRIDMGNTSDVKYFTTAGCK